MFINFLKGSLGIFLGYALVWALSAAFFVGGCILVIYLLLG